MTDAGALDPDATQPIDPVRRHLRTVGIEARNLLLGHALPSGNQTGQALGRYPVLGRLGAGGMGQVLEVLDPELGRVVAAKVILGDAKSTLLSKFVQEAQVTGQLDHPNIVPVYELGMTSAGRLYYTMKRVQGSTLEQLIEASPAPSLVQLLQIFLKVCEALALAHSRGVIHRDLKPSNIMVGQFGEVLVLDWGLASVRGDRCPADDPVADALRLDLGPIAERARAGREQPLRTISGAVVGTPAYMPPEQAHGQVERLDHRSDIYSLGAVLYQILTGTAPFAGENVWEILYAVGAGRLIPPADRAPVRRIPWELDAVTTRAMALRRRDRYQTVTELQADVQAFLEGQTLVAARYSLWQLVRKWAWRRRGLVASLLAISLVTLGSGAYAFVQVEAARRQAVAARNMALQQRDAAREQKRQALAAQHAERRQRQIADRARQGEAAQRRIAEQHRDTLRDQLRRSQANLLAYLAEGLIGQERTLEALVYLGAAAERARTPRVLAACWTSPRPPLRLLALIGEKLGPLAFSADGRRLAVAPRVARGGWAPSAPSPAVHVWDLTAGKRIRVIPNGRNPVRTLSLSPDGRRLMIAAEEEKLARLYSIADGRLVRTLAGHPSPVSAVAFSPDGKLAATGSWDWSVRLWEAGTGKCLRVLQGEEGSINAIAFSPDGRLLASSGESQTVSLWNTATGRLVRRIAGGRGTRFSADGRWLAVQSKAGTLLIDVATGKPAQTLARVTAGGFADRTSYLGLRDGWICLFDIASGRLVRKLFDEEPPARYRAPGSIARFATGPGRRLLIERGGGLLLYRCEPAGAPAHLTLGTPETGVRRVWFPPGGRWVAREGASGVQMWEVATGKLRPTPGGHENWGYLYEFSADGRLVAGRGALHLGDIMRRTVVVWRTDTGQVLWSLPHKPRRSHGTSGMAAVRFSPDGRLLVTRHDSTIWLWDLTRGKLQRKLELEQVYQLGKSGRRMAALPRGRLRFWPGGKFVEIEGYGSLDLVSGRLFAQAVHKSKQRISPDGKWIARSIPRGVEILEAASGKLLQRLGGDKDSSFTPDGRVLAVAGKGRITLFDVGGGVDRGSVPGNGPIAFSADGRLLASTLPDGRVRIWGTHAPWSSAAAEQISGMRLAGLNRTWLTPGQWQQAIRQGRGRDRGK